MAKKILLVDDDERILSVYETGLKAAGYEVTTAKDAATATSSISSNKFDLILLDEMLPDKSGNEILKELRANEATKGVTVAILSNFGHEEIVKEALNLGAVDYILKYQASADDLVIKVKGIVGE